MFCGSCGAEVTKDNRFCSVCGQAVVDTDDMKENDVAKDSVERDKPESISNVPAWILAFLSPVVLTIFTAIFRREMDGIVPVVIILAIVNFIIGYIDLKRIQKTGLSKGKTALLTVALLFVIQLYLILRATIISGFNIKRFITSVVNVVLIIVFAIVAPMITRTTINDVLPEIEYSIVRRYSTSNDESYYVSSPLRLMKTGEYITGGDKYEGMISLVSDSGYDLDLTVEVVLDGDHWQWSAHG
jgi:sorbitol-specific phosphotransferase system component IIC